MKTAGSKFSTGRVSFTHPDYIDNSIADVYEVAEADKKSLRVVMAAGRNVSGTVVDSQGKPVEGVMVKCRSSSPSRVRKAILTDSNGEYSLKGLPVGPATISCVDYARDQKYRQSLTLTTNQVDLQLKLQPIDLPGDLVVHEIFGLQFVDNTQQLAEAYWHNTSKGAFIMSPGERFPAGAIEKGDRVWIIGHNEIEDTSEMINQLIAEADKQEGDVRYVRVVYYFDRLRMEGTNTQHIPLTVQDLEALKALQQK